MPTATCKRVYLPKLGHFVQFHDRHDMKRGHPKRSFEIPAVWPRPALPIDYAKALSFPMYGNDHLGDCMYAAGCHADNTFTGNSGSESAFDESTLERDYEQLSGGDNGLDEGTLIDGWKKGLAGVSAANILDALDIDTTDAATMQAAIFLFGGVLFMLDVPDPWCDTQNGDSWDVPATADQNNGHGTFINGVDAQGNYHLLTWGGYRKLTPAGLKVCDPSGFVVFSLRWFNSQGYAPNGLHYTQLAALWTAAGGNSLPPSPFPAPAPTPIPAPPVPTPTPSNWAQVLAFVQQILTWLFHPASVPAEVKTVFARKGIAPEAIPIWLTVIIQALIAKSPAVIAVVVADIQAGKTWAQILEDVLSAIVAPVTAAA
jgi:hypothetical protein